ncbi:Hydroxyacylglutathione hydrolase [Candidatus Hepatincola sp. Pdp]
MEIEKIYKDANYRILKLPLKNAIIHVFTGLQPLSVNSFIIETNNNLVIIDAQLSIENATLLNKYANSLNKPMAKVILTHAHYDHYRGLSVFPHEITYALAETIADFAKLEVEANVIPLNALPKNFTVENLTYECFNFKNAHCPNHLVMYIKEIKTLVLGDLAQENTHLLAMNFPSFIHTLTTIKKQFSKAEYLLTGHGKITPLATISTNLAYMTKCFEIYKNSKSNEEFNTKVLQEFPNMVKINPPLYYLFQGDPSIPIETKTS